jgi:hypothetical protein
MILLTSPLRFVTKANEWNTEYFNIEYNMIDPIEKFVLFLAFVVLIKYQCEKQQLGTDNVNYEYSSTGISLLDQINNTAEKELLLDTSGAEK